MEAASISAVTKINWRTNRNQFGDTLKLEGGVSTGTVLVTALLVADELLLLAASTAAATIGWG